VYEVYLRSNYSVKVCCLSYFKVVFHSLTGEIKCSVSEVCRYVQIWIVKLKLYMTF